MTEDDRKDYEKELQDLTDKRFFRDLGKPIGALDPEKLGARKSLSLIRSQGRTPSLYESTQMSLMTVITYLMRIEPFTSIHLDLQNGVFDRPERLFTSVGGSFRLLTFLANDFRELVPEFFCTLLRFHDCPAAARSVHIPPSDPRAEKTFHFPENRMI